jgi:hypothetical protein
MVSIAPKVRVAPAAATAPEPVEKKRKSPSPGPTYVAWVAAVMLLLSTLTVVYLMVVPG